MSDVSSLSAGQPLATGLATTAALRGTGLQSLAVAQVEPADAELTRAGRRFFLGFAASVTGIAPVQTIPSTAAQWLIWNTSLTKSLVMDRIGMVLVSGVAGAGIVLYGGLVGTGTQPTTLPTANDAHVLIGSANNGSTSPTTSSVAVVASAQTLAAAPKGGITPLAFNAATNTTAILSVAVMGDLVGKLIIPPLNGLALYVGSPAGTSPLYAPVGSWTELELTLV